MTSIAGFDVMKIAPVMRTAFVIVLGPILPVTESKYTAWPATTVPSFRRSCVRPWPKAGAGTWHAT